MTAREPPRGRHGETGRVTLVGTVHLSPTSRERVVSAVRERDPDVVAVELDPLLFRAYWHRERLTAANVFGRVSDRLAEQAIGGG